jgi:hypothetical protein
MVSVRGIAAVAAVSCVIGLSACASASGNEQPGDAAAQDQVMLQVQNNHWLDMAVYLIRGGTRFRLGTVGSMDTKDFQLTPDLAFYATDLRLQFDPIGARESFVTEPLFVTPGEVMMWRLQNYLPASSYMLKPIAGR